MSLTSFGFLLFLAAVVAVYYIVPKKIQWIVLLAASYGFYLSSGLDHAAYIVATTLFTYAAGRLMQRIRTSGQAQIARAGQDITKERKREIKKAADRKIHRIQVLTVLVNLSVLAYFKYLNFFIGGLNEAFGFFRWDFSLPMINLLAPLGLSYYTFNTIGYLIDVGRGKLAAEKHLGRFALFVSFFPSIVQGPLNRYGDLGPQLSAPHKFDYNNLKFGAQLMLWGFFKKLVIADRVAPIVSTIFSPSFTNYSGSHIVIAVIAYSLQIYGDFSGGVDIIRGAAQMLGIDLPLNFSRPFFATSMADFWRRWHMSLGAWMREYVFYPIMLCRPVTAVSKFFRKRFGSYAGKIVPSVAAPLVVFFLIGIWHDLTSQYIVNGLYNALLISASVACAPLFRKLTEKLHINTEAFSFRLFQMIRTFCLMCVSRIIVKAPSLSDAWKMLRSVFTSVDLAFVTGADGALAAYGLPGPDIAVLAVSVFILLIVGILQEWGVKIRETLSQQSLVFRWSMVLLLLFGVLIFGLYGPSYNASSFIYGRF